MERKSVVVKVVKNSINYYQGLQTPKWSPRSYNCTFCNRQFNSAQALGGHMNVHRKERARQIRHSPPPHHHFDINVQPSEEEESWTRPRSPSSSPSKKFGNSSALTRVKSPSLSPPSWGEIKKRTTNFINKDDDANVSKLGLDLKIGNLVSNHHNLDLELRLGFSKN